jgi:uncharacterized protein YggE
MGKDAVAMAVAILFVLSGSAAAGAPSAPAYEPAASTIRVSGKGSVQVEPNTATIRIGVTTERLTATEAVSANTGATSKVISELEAAGVEKKDLRTSNFSVYPQYKADGENRHQLVGFRVSNTVAVTIRDTAKVGDILTKAVAAGSNQINGPTFSVSEPEKYLDEARKKAVENAMEKARAYAAAAGKKLGEVLEISEPGVPAPSFNGGFARSLAAAAPVPIETGEERIEAQIFLVIELK